jgi:hypothetical protein
MKRERIWQTGAVALLATFVALVLAQRPLATEDVDILEPAECAWGTFEARELSPGSPSPSGIATQVGCGMGHASQLAATCGCLLSDGDTTLGLVALDKIGPIARTAQSPGLSLAWALSGARLATALFPHEGTQSNLVVSHTAAPAITTHGNLGWLLSAAERSSRSTWNLVVEYAFAAGTDGRAGGGGNDRIRPAEAFDLCSSLSDHFGVNASHAGQFEESHPQLLTVDVNFLL